MRFSVALSARKIFMQESMPRLEQRRQKVLNDAKSFSGSTTDGHYVYDDDEEYFVSNTLYQSINSQSYTNV